jgi:hypothetical protein
VDGPQASGLHSKPEAQGLQREEKRPQSQLCCHCILGHCSFGHHHPQQLLRSSIGRDHDHANNQGMMVHASVHMEYVSMHGWAIGHGSFFNLPLHNTPTGHHLQPDLPRLPYRNCGEGDHQVGSLASLVETLRHSLHKSQEIHDSCEKTSRCVSFLAGTKSYESMINLCFTTPATFIFTKFVPNKLNNYLR